MAKVGAVILPLDDGYVTTTMRVVADPARDVLMELIAASIIANTQAAFDNAAEGTKLENLSVIENKIPFDPNIWLARTAKVKFPILCVYREGTPLISEFTLEVDQAVTEWKAVYILPQMDIQEHGKLYTQLNAVRACIIDVINKGSHPDYNDGYASLGSANDGAGFYRVDVTSAEFGEWEVASPDGDGIIYPTLTTTIRSIELLESSSTDTSDFELLEGVDITVYLESDDPLKIIEARTDATGDEPVVPTIYSPPGISDDDIFAWYKSTENVVTDSSNLASSWGDTSNVSNIPFGQDNDGDKPTLINRNWHDTYPTLSMTNDYMINDLPDGYIGFNDDFCIIFVANIRYFGSGYGTVTVGTNQNDSFQALRNTSTKFYFRYNTTVDAEEPSCICSSDLSTADDDRCRAIIIMKTKPNQYVEITNIEGTGVITRGTTTAIPQGSANWTWLCIGALARGTGPDIGFRNYQDVAELIVCSDIEDENQLIQYLESKYFAPALTTTGINRVFADFNAAKNITLDGSSVDVWKDYIHGWRLNNYNENKPAYDPDGWDTDIPVVDFYGVLGTLFSNNNRQIPDLVDYGKKWCVSMACIARHTASGWYFSAGNTADVGPFFGITSNSTTEKRAWYRQASEGDEFIADVTVPDIDDVKTIVTAEYIPDTDLDGSGSLTIYVKTATAEYTATDTVDVNAINMNLNVFALASLYRTTPAGYGDVKFARFLIGDEFTNREAHVAWLETLYPLS